MVFKQLFKANVKEPYTDCSQYTVSTSDAFKAVSVRHGFIVISKFFSVSARRSEILKHKDVGFLLLSKMLIYTQCLHMKMKIILIIYM